MWNTSSLLISFPEGGIPDPFPDPQTVQAIAMTLGCPPKLYNTQLPKIAPLLPQDVESSRWYRPGSFLLAS